MRPRPSQRMLLSTEPEIPNNDASRNASSLLAQSFASSLERLSRSRLNQSCTLRISLGSTQRAANGVPGVSVARKNGLKAVFAVTKSRLDLNHRKASFPQSGGGITHLARSPHKTSAPRFFALGNPSAPAWL